LLIDRLIKQYDGNKNTKGGSSDRRDGGRTGEEEEDEEIPIGEEEVDGMERKLMIEDVLVLPLLPKQKETTMMMIIVTDLAVAVEWRLILQGSINDSAEGEDSKHPCC